MDLSQLLRGDGAPGAQPPLVSGHVSSARAAPAGFEDPVWVIVPSHSIDRPYGPCAWPAIHGATLPVHGTPVWVAFDEHNVPVVVSWTGTHT
jgi:hypothetical protein